MRGLPSYFYPRSPCGERLHYSLSFRRGGIISIHALLAESDAAAQRPFQCCPISIHALLAESDGVRAWASGWMAYFYPRSPCGERPALEKYPVMLLIFLSTLSLRRATTLLQAIVTHLPISIHALLAESDAGCGHVARRHEISIHALLAESDGPRLPRSPWAGDFYPRSPCGERPILGIPNQVGTWISIHALLAESDRSKPLSRQRPSKFLSTLSLRRATGFHKINCQMMVISIHALLAESDWLWDYPPSQ